MAVLGWTAARLVRLFLLWVRSLYPTGQPLLSPRARMNIPMACYPTPNNVYAIKLHSSCRSEHCSKYLMPYSPWQVPLVDDTPMSKLHTYGLKVSGFSLHPYCVGFWIVNQV
jgi:hypothetical protein